MVRDASAKDLPIAIGHIRDSETDTRAARVHPIVGVGRIDKMQELPDGRFLIELVGRGRVRIVDEKETTLPYRVVRGALVEDGVADQRAGARASTILRHLIVGMQQADPDAAHALSLVISGCETPGALADAIAGVLQTDAGLRQTWLEEANPVVRLEKVTDALEIFVAQARPSSGPAN